jgi:hypothetical protein
VSFFQTSPEPLSRTPPPTTLPHLIAPNPAHPQSGRTLNSVPSPAAPSRPLLSSSPASPATISLCAATVARATLSARLHHHAEADLPSPRCVVAVRDAQPAADLFPTRLLPPSSRRRGRSRARPELPLSWFAIPALLHANCFLSRLQSNDYCQISAIVQLHD